MSEETNKKKKISSVVGIFPFDCWGEVISHFRYPREVHALVYTIRGLAAFLVSNYVHFRHILFDIDSKRFPATPLPISQNLLITDRIQRTNVLQTLSSYFPNAINVDYTAFFNPDVFHTDISSIQKYHVSCELFRNIKFLQLELGAMFSEKTELVVFGPAQLPVLEKLSLDCIRYPKSSSESALRRFEDVPCIDISFFNVECPRLSHLFMKGLKLKTVPEFLRKGVKVWRVQHFFPKNKHISNLPNLETLTIENANSVERIENLPNLETLEFKYVGTDSKLEISDSFEHRINREVVFVKSISNFPNLKVLKIVRKEASDRYFSLKSISDLKSLEKLVLKNIGKSEIRLKALPNLKKLKLIHCVVVLDSTLDTLEKLTQKRCIVRNETNLRSLKKLVNFRVIWNVHQEDREVLSILSKVTCLSKLEIITFASEFPELLKIEMIKKTLREMIVFVEFDTWDLSMWNHETTISDFSVLEKLDMRFSRFVAQEMVNDVESCNQMKGFVVMKNVPKLEDVRIRTVFVNYIHGECPRLFNLQIYGCRAKEIRFEKTTLEIIQIAKSEIEKLVFNRVDHLREVVVLDSELTEFVCSTNNLDRIIHEGKSLNWLRGFEIENEVCHFSCQHFADFPFFAECGSKEEDKRKGVRVRNIILDNENFVLMKSSAYSKIPGVEMLRVNGEFGGDSFKDFVDLKKLVLYEVISSKLLITNLPNLRNLKIHHCPPEELSNDDYSISVTIEKTEKLYKLKLQRCCNLQLKIDPLSTPKFLNLTKCSLKISPELCVMSPNLVFRNSVLLLPMQDEKVQTFSQTLFPNLTCFDLANEKLPRLFKRAFTCSIFDLPSLLFLKVWNSVLVSSIQDLPKCKYMTVQLRKEMKEFKEFPRLENLTLIPVKNLNEGGVFGFVSNISLVKLPSLKKVFTNEEYVKLSPVDCGDYAVEEAFKT